jgi:hypothetical protein
VIDSACQNLWFPDIHHVARGLRYWSRRPISVLQSFTSPCAQVEFLALVTPASRLSPKIPAPRYIRRMIAAAQRLPRLTCLPVLAIALLLSLAACETPHGSVAGGTSGDSGGAGRIRVGWPF